MEKGKRKKGKGKRKKEKVKTIKQPQCGSLSWLAAALEGGGREDGWIGDGVYDVIAIGSFLRREMGSSLLAVIILAGVEAEIQRHSALRAKARYSRLRTLESLAL